VVRTVWQEAAWPGASPASRVAGPLQTGLQPPPLLVGQGSAGRRTPTGLLRSDGSVLFDSPVFSVTPQPMTGSRTPHFVVNLAEVRPRGGRVPGFLPCTMMRM